MKKNFTLFVILCFVVLSLQTTGAFAAEPEPQHYIIGLHPVEPDRGVRVGECVGKWNKSIPGLMGTTEGFRGNKSLAPLTPIIFPENQLGKMIPARQQLTLWGCGNGFMSSIPLDTAEALGIFCNTLTPSTASSAVSVPQTAEVKVVPKPPFFPSPKANIRIFYKGEEVTSVHKGAEVAVVWDSTDAEHCDALYGLGFETKTLISGKSVVTLKRKGNYRYTVQCQGSGGFAVAETSVQATGGRIWGWFVVVAIAIGLVAAGHSGGHNNGSVRSGPTIP